MAGRARVFEWWQDNTASTKLAFRILGFTDIGMSGLIRVPGFSVFGSRGFRKLEGFRAFGLWSIPAIKLCRHCQLQVAGPGGTRDLDK